MAALVLSSAAVTSRADAHGLDFNEGRWVCKVGLPLAASFGRRPASFVSGVEGNCGIMSYSGFWGGAYADAQWSFGREMVRLSLGPMVGWGFVGFDGGYLLAQDSIGTRHGFTVRHFLTLGLVALYYRFGSLFEPREYLHDFGVLLQWPVYVQKQRPARSD